VSDTPAAIDLPTRYAPAEVEATLYDRWWPPGTSRSTRTATSPYAIVIPPPNVTGSLHLGHAFEHTLIDALVRRGACRATRHCGCRAWTTRASPPERRRARAAIRAVRHDWAVRRSWRRSWSGGRVRGKTWADAPVWATGGLESAERFTMDERACPAPCSPPCQAELYDDGLIYRGQPDQPTGARAATRRWIRRTPEVEPHRRSVNFGVHPLRRRRGRHS